MQSSLENSNNDMVLNLNMCKAPHRLQLKLHLSWFSSNVFSNFDFYRTHTIVLGKVIFLFCVFVHMEWGRGQWRQTTGQGA